MPSQHSMLSPSSAKRWMTCTASVIATFHIKNETSEFAKEGTCAHELAEYKVKLLLSEETTDPTENLEYYDQEMEGYCEDYAAFISEQAIDADLVAVEQKLDLSRWIPEAFGTSDCIIIKDKTLHVIDLKYGKGVAVDAEDNPQMKIYALGALNAFDMLFDIDDVVMTIYQPRISNISSSCISKEDLLTWAETELKPKAEIAFHGEGEFVPGEHCRWCGIRNTCRARADKILELTKWEFKNANRLKDDEIAEILKLTDELISWTNDVKEYALNKLLKGGKLPGYKLVEGRATRKFINDEEAIVKLVKEEGYDPYSHTLMGITALTSLLGKAKFQELLGGYVVKPNGKPTLALVSDKRKEISTLSDFTNN